ncbi:hypothetical protein SCOCK_1140002 [Actinacidiphila cocklensis]|uniref:Uncharacterized protein n=1 Tax=Actinacidiphila cocklensis TaxID=887465 RepID=A0A9W4E155_9ACTN|nr:hypothetical protein SCOCK_1140002 [Actinacidiphila cocklensis]
MGAEHPGRQGVPGPRRKPPDRSPQGRGPTQRAGRIADRRETGAVRRQLQTPGRQAERGPARGTRRPRHALVEIFGGDTPEGRPRGGALRAYLLQRPRSLWLGHTARLVNT